MNSTNVYHYNIAEHNIKITFESYNNEVSLLLKSFKKFETTKSENNYFFSFTIKEEKDITLTNDFQLLTKSNNGNGDVEYFQASDGSYKIIIKNYKDEDCAYLYSNSTFTNYECVLMNDHNSRCYGINNTLLMAFSLSGAAHQTALIHASVVRYNNKAYAFIAKSGTGKSTQVSSWLRYIANCDLVNDDSPIIRLVNNEVWLYGSPWSGKTTCYRNIKVKLGAITRIVRDDHNEVEEKPLIANIASLLPSLSTMKWDSFIYTESHKIAINILKRVPHYHLHCLPNKEAALICHQTIAQ